MGTAPGSSQHPAMPDPKHTVSRSVTVAQSRGNDLQASLYIIVGAVEIAAHALGHAGIDDVPWLDQVRDEAITRLRNLDPSYSKRTETGNANG